MSDSKNISEVNSDLVAISRESIKRDLFNITFIIMIRYICAWLVLSHPQHPANEMCAVQCFSIVLLIEG